MVAFILKSHKAGWSQTRNLGDLGAVNEKLLHSIPGLSQVQLSQEYKVGIQVYKLSKQCQTTRVLTMAAL